MQTLRGLLMQSNGKRRKKKTNKQRIPASVAVKRECPPRQETITGVETRALFLQFGCLIFSCAAPVMSLLTLFAEGLRGLGQRAKRLFSDGASKTLAD